jgi:uridine kinase
MGSAISILVSGPADSGKTNLAVLIARLLQTELPSAHVYLGNQEDSHGSIALNKYAARIQDPYLRDHLARRQLDVIITEASISP